MQKQILCSGGHFFFKKKTKVPLNVVEISNCKSVEKSNRKKSIAVRIIKFFGSTKFPRF